MAVYERQHQRRGSRRRPTVTVVVSVYDRFDRAAVLAAVLARWQAQTLAPEVILSEQAAGAPRWQKLAGGLGIGHALSRPDIADGEARYDIGRVRNSGIVAARGAFLYMTDADVYPLRADYLERLHGQAVRQPDHVWYRPRMFRLAQPAAEDFLAFVAPPGARVEVPAAGGCLCSFAAGCLHLQPEERFQLDGWDYVCTPEEFAQLRSAGFDESQLELIAKPDSHWGGTFLPRAGATAVAGYAEGYLGWGYEDEDFHAKLAGRCVLQPIRSREVVHFEHPRRYNNRAFADNERRYLARARAGAAAMIAADRADARSPFHRPPTVASGDPG